MSGGGTMEPITLDAGVIASYKPPVYTALSLVEYAEIIGINPIQFMSGNSSLLFPNTGCTDRWRQYPWQDPDKTSRDELAREIHQAEIDIASELGYWPGLVWSQDEFVSYPKYYRPGVTIARGVDIAGRVKSVVPRHSKFVAQGVRSVELISTAAVGFLDEDGDGYNEVAYITAPTSYTSPYEHKLFYTDSGGRAEFEIRPVMTKTISGGVIEFRLPVWLLFKPELLAAMPGQSGYEDLDPFNTSNIVDSVDIYYETADPSQGTLFHWNESGLLIDDTGHTTQIAALEPKVEHRVKHSVSVTPATYNAGTQSFTLARFAVGREPDQVELAYLSGDYDTDSRAGMYRVPTDLAQAIAYMATARLPRPLCTQCENVQAKEARLRYDLAVSVDGDSSDVRFIRPDVLRCPFGTRMGEVAAWDVVRSRMKDGDVAPQVAAF